MSTPRTLRYVRSWLTDRTPVHERDVRLEREDRAVCARLVYPAWARGPFPAWILLHGTTRPGIQHPQLLRFARSLASAGALACVPEVPEWKELRLAPGATLPTLRAAVRALRAVPEANDAPRGLMGFSFGGPQALIAASSDEVASEIAGVASFGGYCDLDRTLRFQFTGEHEWNGRWERIENPDPYGRWIVGANYLTASPGFESLGDAARALWELAAAAGERRAPAASPEYDALKERLRATLSPRGREVFDVFAPASGHAPDRDGAEAVIGALVAGSRRNDPLVDPIPFLARLRHPVELLHGRGDRLIPYTESLRLRARLPASAPANLTVTRMFAHAKGDRFPVSQSAREAWTFFRTLRRLLSLV